MEDNSSKEEKSKLTGRGEEEVVLRKVMVTNKAYQQYNELLPDTYRHHIAIALAGLTARRMADNSPWFICVCEDIRYVFIATKGCSEESGYFSLTDVQFQNRQPLPRTSSPLSDSSS